MSRSMSRKLPPMINTGHWTQRTSPTFSNMGISSAYLSTRPRRRGANTVTLTVEPGHAGIVDAFDVGNETVAAEVDFKVQLPLHVE